MYSSYTAAVYPRLWELALQRNVRLQGALTWAFTFLGQPWFAGYRQLSTNGIDLPVLNVFRLFAHLDTDRVAAASSAQVPLAEMLARGVPNTPDVGVLATRAAMTGRMDILLWHYRDDDIPGPAAEIHLLIKGFAQGQKLRGRIWRVDRHNGDAFTEWNVMGAPASPTQVQIARLRQAARMVARRVTLGSPLSSGNIALDIPLPLQGVALIELRPR